MERIIYGNYTKEQAIRVGYDWDDYENGKGDDDLFAEILECENWDKVRHITIANWEGAFECDDCQNIIDWLSDNASQLTHIESLWIGDMSYEECEISWINQADYSKLWAAMPWLKHLKLQGTENLSLGDIVSDALESLEIMCGGLPSDCIKSIEKAKAPHLQKLNLYLGVDSYGFDGDGTVIESLLKNSCFPELTYLGLCNSEIAAEVTQLIADSQYAAQITTLDISKSVFTDESARVFLNNYTHFSNLKKLDLSYHYISTKMQKKLAELPIEIDLSDANEYDEDEEYYNHPMYTE